MAGHSEPPVGRISGISRRQKIKLAAIIIVSIAAGMVIYEGPPSLNLWGTVILQLVLYGAGAIQLSCSSILSWRAGRKLLSLLWGLTALFLFLLSLPLIQRFIELLM